MFPFKHIAVLEKSLHGKREYVLRKAVLAIVSINFGRRVVVRILRSGAWSSIQLWSHSPSLYCEIILKCTRASTDAVNEFCDRIHNQHFS